MAGGALMSIHHVKHTPHGVYGVYGSLLCVFRNKFPKFWFNTQGWDLHCHLRTLWNGWILCHSGFS